MSEPKRYERCYHKDYIPEGMEEHYNGKWVSYADYARLKAEVERLRNIGIKLDGYVDLVRHENERLRKAGDALQGALLRLTSGTPNWNKELYWNWTAAKEGKPSV